MAALESSSHKQVYIGVEQGGQLVVYEARDYQQEAYYVFMSNRYMTRAEFEYPRGIKFSIQAFDSGFGGSYESFCTFVNESGQQFTMSTNASALKGMIGYRNRVSSGGKKSKRKKKSVKKK